MDDTGMEELFSATYAQARRRFLGAASARGLPVESHQLPVAGLEDETLATDVVRDGPEDASRLLVVISGVHGVEGFCGSAMQRGLQRLNANEAAADLEDTATLYVHAVNPYGFSHLRRVTHENIDPNRNFGSRTAGVTT